MWVGQPGSLAQPTPLGSRARLSVPARPTSTCTAYSLSSGALHYHRPTLTTRLHTLPAPSAVKIPIARHPGSILSSRAASIAPLPVDRRCHSAAATVWRFCHGHGLCHCDAVDRRAALGCATLLNPLLPLRQLDSRQPSTFLSPVQLGRQGGYTASSGPF